MTRLALVFVGVSAWLGCDPPSGLGRVPSGPDVPDAAPEPEGTPLRCGSPVPPSDVQVDPVGGRGFVMTEERVVARGGPWRRGATNRVGTLVAPDAACGVRVFEREQVDGGVAVRDRGCVAGLDGTDAVQLFFNQNVYGLCAVHAEGALHAGRIDLARAALVSRMTVGAAAARCGQGDWWEAAIAADATGRRQIQFLDDDFRPRGPLNDLPDESGAPTPVAIVNNQSRWDGLWRVAGDGALLHERYRPVGEFAFGAVYPTRVDGVVREASRRWNAARVGARRVEIFDSFDKGGGLLAVARLEGTEGAWVDGLLFCAGADAQARRLHNGPVLDARLVGVGTDQVLLTLRRDGDAQVIDATWISSDFSARGEPHEIARAPGLILLGADVAPRVGSFLVWHARAVEGLSELRVAAFELTR